MIYFSVSGFNSSRLFYDTDISWMSYSVSHFSQIGTSMYLSRYLKWALISLHDKFHLSKIWYNSHNRDKLRLSSFLLYCAVLQVCTSNSLFNGISLKTNIIEQRIKCRYTYADTQSTLSVALWYSPVFHRCAWKALVVTLHIYAIIHTMYRTFPLVSV